MLRSYGPWIQVPNRSVGSQIPRWPFTLNLDSPLAQGLIGWWPMTGPTFSKGRLSNLAPGYGKNEGVVETAGGEDFIEPGGASGFLTGEVCRFVNVDGASEGWFAVADPDDIYSPPADGDSITVLCWVEYTGTFATANREALWGKDVDFDRNGWGAYIEDLATDEFRPYIGDWDNGVVTGASQQLEITRWYRLGARLHWVQDNNRVESLIDGVETGSATHAREPINTGTLYVGALGQSGSNGFREFLGGMCNLAIWDRALTDGEVEYDFDPATRWDLFYELGRRTWFLPAPAAGGAASLVPPPRLRSAAYLRM